MEEEPALEDHGSWWPACLPGCCPYRAWPRCRLQVPSHPPHPPQPPTPTCALQELEAAAARYPGGVLVLTDPDVAGRQARRALDDRLPGRCLHAFLPTPLATAHTATRYEAAQGWCVLGGYMDG